MFARLFSVPVAPVLAGLLIAASSSASEREPVSLTHDFWVGYAPLFVGIEKGYFAEAGLELKTQSTTTPADSLVPLLSGNIDIAVSTLDSVIAANDKQPEALTIVALIDASYGADAMIAQESIKKLEDLKGKEVAVALGQASHFLALKALESVGMKASDVKLVNMDPGDAGGALAAGKLAACVTWEPWITKATSQSKANVLFSTKDLPNTIINAVVVSKKTLKDRPAMIEKFLDALGKGYEFIGKDRAAAAAITGKKLEQSQEEILGMMDKDQLIDLAKSKELMGTADKPGPIHATASGLAKFLAENKVINSSEVAPSLFDSKFLK